MTLAPPTSAGAAGGRRAITIAALLATFMQSVNISLPNAAALHMQGGRRAITIAALLATFMQSVNISLPNAAALHMQGVLQLTDDELGWMFTSYIACSMVVMPMTRWLAGRFGRKSVFLWSLVVFAFATVLDTRAETTLQLVAARALQGAASGTLTPLALTMLLDGAPPQRHPRINLIWTTIATLGILGGPALGGWVGEYYGWRAIFYLSLPMVGFIFLAVALSLPETKMPGGPSFDAFGLTALSVGLLGLQMVLDRGERMEWFASPEIWIEAAASATGFFLFGVHVLTSNTHFLSKALFKDRNLVVSAAMYFALGFVLVPTVALTSPMLEELLGYPVDLTGYMTVPRAVALIAALLLASLAPARFDRRLFVACGAALVIWGCARMLGYSPGMDWRFVVTAGVVQGVGLGLMMSALSRTAFSTLAPSLRPEGTVLFNLARLYGSTIGIAIVQIYFFGNTQAAHLSLAKNLVPYRAAAHVDGALSLQALAGLNNLVTGQAALIAIIGQFKILMIAMLIAGPLVLLLRKPRPAA
jgi:DHA2 family multidrug resistance protein